MAYDFPSAEWCVAYKDAINANAAYKQAAKDWTYGVVAMVVKADPALKIDQDTGMWLDVHQGSCKECKLVSMDEAQHAAFVLVADYTKWKSVIRGELDPTKGMMQGKLKLTKGNMPTMVKYVNASKELVASTQKVPTKFRDE